MALGKKNIGMRSAGFAVSALFLLGSACPALAQEFSGRVVGVSDGDTLTVLRAGRAVRVRLNGIDAPEKRQPWGTKAKQFTSDRVFGKTVKVLPRDTDRYGRTVADVVFAGATVPNKTGGNLNRELVGAGLAWHYRQYAPNDTVLARLEAEARAARRGLWSDAGPVPPWEFRRGGSVSGRAARTLPTLPTLPTRRAGGNAGQAAGGVYLTATGKRYHRGGCRSLRGGATAATVTEATGRGLTACKVCRP